MQQGQRNEAHYDQSEEQRARPEQPPSFCACLELANLNDPRYVEYCMVALCCCPGWCYIQHKIWEELEATDTVSIKHCEELIRLLCSPSIRGFTCCCFGLALNRSIFRKATGGKE